MRVGVVGLGWAARAFHVPALKQLPSVQLVGGADSDPEQRSSWETETGLGSFASFEELLEKGRPEAIVVATPPHSHADLCVAALEAGLHVICEKPFVADVAEADRVLAAAAAAGRQVAVNHEFREMPIFRALKEQIGTADVGRLVFCQIWQLMDLAPWDEPVAWRAAMPNRTLFEGGVHLVDLLMLLFGEKPTAVYARHSSGFERERRADAIHLVTLEFSDGRLGADHDRPPLQGRHPLRRGARRLRARVAARLARRPRRRAARQEAGGEDRPPDRLRPGRARVGRARADAGSRSRGALETRPCTRRPSSARRIIAAFEAGSEPPSSGREARDVLEVIEAAYRSAETGQRIELAPAARRPQLTILGSGIGTMKRPPRPRKSCCCSAISSAKFHAITST